LLNELRTPGDPDPSQSSLKNFAIDQAASETGARRCANALGKH
jgi:hypothetical protein